MIGNDRLFENLNVSVWMSRERQSKQEKVPAGGRNLFWIIGLVILAGCLTGLWLYQGARLPGPSSGKPVLATDFSPLTGKWLRPDGGYVIDIRNIRPDGRMEASYLNPRAIHVSKAEASEVEGSLRVFIELQDTGYPGSSYTLVYNAQKDMLVGVYYQAASGQSFNVLFVRKNR